MVNTIIRDYNKIFTHEYVKGKEKFILKFNSEMEKLGVKNVVLSETINQDVLEEDITIYFNPTILKGEVRYTSRLNYKPFYQEMIKLEGFSSFSSFYRMPYVKFTPIYYKVGEKKCNIGQYLPERNVIILHFKAKTSSGVEDKKEYFEFRLKVIK
ncbi:MAG: hypothetical protein R3321_13110, partial [Nitrososphaeraceae archaeon]|nr:hypothetical protein [Nitrososphaeraceae archaeon]